MSSETNVSGFARVRVAVKSSEGHYYSGSEAIINLMDVSALIPVRHSYHSFRPHQDLTKIKLRSGDEILAMGEADGIAASLGI